MSKGRFICIEGSDASGKKTQVGILKDNLEAKGHKVKVLDFPDYDSFFGSLISKYLRGEFGDLDELQPEIPSILYALDRYQHKEQLHRDMVDFDFVLANRYTQSNLAFQGAKFPDADERAQFIQWVEQMESRIPQPDLVIFLYVPIEVSQELMESREDKEYLQGEKKDIHEKDREYQKKVSDVYQELSERLDWELVYCTEDDEMRSIEDISEEVLELLADCGYL